MRIQGAAEIAAERPVARPKAARRAPYFLL